MTLPTTDGTTTVLAYIPSPPQGVWYLGPLPIRAYALCIIVGIIVAVWWGNRRWIARGGQDGDVLDIAVWAVPFGLVGGRLYHLATDWRTYFGGGPKTPIDALKIWDGGLGIWGAVLLGAVGAWIGARRHGIKLPPFGDAIAPTILLAQAIGRLGNYFNQELYGRETTVPWGLKIYERVDSAGNVDPGLISGVSNGHVVAIVHPTFLYELLWDLLIVIVLVVVDRRFRLGHGRLFALYVAGYCVGRFGVELMRSDPATHIAGIRINLFTAALVFACAAVYFVLAPKGRERGLEIYRPERADELEALGYEGYTEESRFHDDDDEFDGVGTVESDPPDRGRSRGVTIAPSAAVAAGVATAGASEAVAEEAVNEKAADEKAAGEKAADEKAADEKAADDTSTTPDEVDSSADSKDATTSDPGQADFSSESATVPESSDDVAGSAPTEPESDTSKPEPAELEPAKPEPAELEPAKPEPDSAAPETVEAGPDTPKPNIPEPDTPEPAPTQPEPTEPADVPTDTTTTADVPPVHSAELWVLESDKNQAASAGDTAPESDDAETPKAPSGD